MFGALAKIAGAIGAKVLPKATPVLGKAITDFSGLTKGAATTVSSKVFPRFSQAAARLGVTPTITMSKSEAARTLMPIGSKAKIGLALAGVGAGTGIVGWEALKAKVAPPKYENLPTVGATIPGTIPGDIKTPEAGNIFEQGAAWLGDLLKNPKVQWAAGLTGLGAAGLGAYKLYGAVKGRKKPKKAKKGKKPKKYRKTKKYAKKAKGWKKPRPGTKAWMKYIRGKRGKGKGKGKGKGTKAKAGKKERGVPTGMKRQQKIMKAGAKAWKQGKTLGTTYRAHMKAYLQKGGKRPGKG